MRWLLISLACSLLTTAYRVQRRDGQNDYLRPSRLSSATSVCTLSDQEHAGIWTVFEGVTITKGINQENRSTKEISRILKERDVKPVPAFAGERVERSPSTAPSSRDQILMADGASLKRLKPHGMCEIEQEHILCPQDFGGSSLVGRHMVRSARAVTPGRFAGQFGAGGGGCRPEHSTPPHLSRAGLGKGPHTCR